MKNWSVCAVDKNMYAMSASNHQHLSKPSQDEPPATEVTVLQMESGMNKRCCLNPVKQHHMASGSLNEDNDREGNDIVCFVPGLGRLPIIFNFI